MEEDRPRHVTLWGRNTIQDQWSEGRPVLLGDRGLSAARPLVSRGTPGDMSDLTTRAAVKSYAGVTSNNDDGPISGIVSAVSVLLHGMVGHDYSGEAITGEHHSGPMSGALVLDRPAQSIEEVREGSDTLAATGAYELSRERLVHRLSSGATVSWASGVRNIEVDYTTIDRVPADLEFAAREICAFMVKQSGWGVGSSRMGLSAQANADSGNADYFTQAIRKLPMAKATLARYARFV